MTCALNPNNTIVKNSELITDIRETMIFNRPITVQRIAYCDILYSIQKRDF